MGRVSEKGRDMLKQISLYFTFFLLILTLISPLTVSAQPISSEYTNYLKQGIANLKEENYEEAVEDFKKAREIDPSSSAAAHFLGTAYKKIQNYGEAKVHLKDALQLTPPAKEAVVELADVLYQLGETEESLKPLEAAEKEGIEPAQTAFLKGLVLLKLKRNAEAIDSFQKAKSVDEKLKDSADYQIGIANLQDGRLNEASEIFKEIVVRDPNADIAQFAKQYIDAITKRIREERAFRFAAGVQYQSDDNVLLKPGDVAVAAGITGESDTATITTARAEFVPKLQGAFGFKTQYSYYLNSHQRLTTHDVQSHSITLAPGFNFTKSSISLPAGYNYTLVANDKYLQTISLSPAYTFVLSEKQFTTVTLKYQSKDFLKTPLSTDEDRDGTDSGGGLSWFYLIAENRGFLNLRYESNREDTTGKNWKYSGNKAGFGLLYPLIGNLNFNMGVEAYFQNFDETHTSFNKKRDDKTYNINTMLSYTIHDIVDVQVQYIYIRGNSNISVYDYQKSIVTGGIEIKL